MACGHCHRRKTRVDLTNYDASESLARVAAKCWCRRCGPSKGRSYLHFELIAIWQEERRKPIAFNGSIVIKLGMH